MQEGEIEEDLGQWSVYCSLRALRAGASGGLVDLFEDYLARLLELGVAGVTVGECEGARIAERYSRRIRGLQSQFWTDDVLISAREENAWLQREKPTHVLYPYPFYHNLYSRHSGVEDWQEWTRAVVCIPDVQHLAFPRYFTATERKDRDELFNEALERATRVFTISESSSESLLEAYGTCHERAPIAWPHGKGASTWKSGNGTHVLYPANDWPHKNHTVLLEAWSILQAENQRIPLVLTGARGKLSPDLKDQIAAWNLGGVIEDRDYVAREELDALVQHARCLIFPSLFEGFGMPILEAMEKGIPVVCSRIPVLEEVAGEAAAYFDPHSGKSVAKVINEVWNDAARRKGMIALGRARARHYGPKRTATSLKVILSLQGGEDPVGQRQAKLENWNLILPPGRQLIKGKRTELERIVGRWPGTDLFLLDAQVDEYGKKADAQRQWDDPGVYHSDRFVWQPQAGALVGQHVEAVSAMSAAELAMRIEAEKGVVRVLKGRWCEGRCDALALWKGAIEARWNWVGDEWLERTPVWIWESLVRARVGDQPWVVPLYGLWRRLLYGGEAGKAMARSLLLASLPWLVSDHDEE